MDLTLHLRVLSRHRKLLIGGLAAAFVLAFLAFVRVGPEGVSFRQAEKWESVTRLAVAPGGDPFGSAGTPDDGGFQDPTTFAVVAAQFATSSEVKRLIQPNGPIKGEILAAPATTESGSFLPFIDVTAIAASGEKAGALSMRAALAISQFVEDQQAKNGTRPSRRMDLKVVTRKEPELLEARKKGTPMFIFLGIASLTLGAVYVRENMQRSREAGSSSTAAPPRPDEEESPGEQAATPAPVALPDRRPKRKIDSKVADSATRPSTLYIDSAADGRSHASGEALPRVDEGSSQGL